MGKTNINLIEILGKIERHNSLINIKYDGQTGFEVAFVDGKLYIYIPTRYKIIPRTSYADTLRKQLDAIEVNFVYNEDENFWSILLWEGEL